MKVYQQIRQHESDVVSGKPMDPTKDYRPKMWFSWSVCTVPLLLCKPDIKFIMAKDMMLLYQL